MEKDIPPENTMLAIIRYRDVFNIMLKAMRATKILEIGTSAGYSTRRFIFDDDIDPCKEVVDLLAA